MKRDARIYVAGHTGLVGSALVRRLRARGHENLCLPASRVDLTDHGAAARWFRSAEPEYVFLAAAKVGGILANRDECADFIRVNLAIATNVIALAHEHGVRKLLFLGSSCIYPKLAPQPIREEYLLGGPLEETNEAYAIAKIAGLVMCRSYNRQHGTNFIAAMPTNLYGPGDNFDLRSSHVLPALIRRFHEAKLQAQPAVTLWGSGTPRREFLYVDDMADACIFMMDAFDATPERHFLNVGVGEDISIADLASVVARAVGFEGQILWDAGKPDGAPRKLLDVSRLSELGWRASTTLEHGISKTLDWFVRERALPARQAS